MGNHIAKPSNKSMVDRLVEHHSYIHSPVVEGVFRAVDRAMYFDFEEGEAIDPYDDDPWRRGNLHISAPCIYAKVVEALDLRPGMSFLNLGSGTGYLNTIIGLLVGPNGINHGIEFHSDVVDYAYQKLQLFKQKSYAIDKYDFAEPTFIKGNCLDLNPSSMKYDRIYLGAACLPDLENFMKKLIKPNGGILVMPYENHLMRYVRVSETIWESEKLMGVNFTLMIRRDADINYDNNIYNAGDADNNNNGSKLINMPLAQAKSLKELCRITIRQQLREKTNSLNPNLLNSDNISSRRKRKERAERELFLRHQEHKRKIEFYPCSLYNTQSTSAAPNNDSTTNRKSNSNKNNNNNSNVNNNQHRRRIINRITNQPHQANCNCLGMFRGCRHSNNNNLIGRTSKQNNKLNQESSSLQQGTSSCNLIPSPNVNRKSATIVANSRQTNRTRDDNFNFRINYNNNDDQQEIDDEQSEVEDTSELELSNSESDSGDSSQDDDDNDNDNDNDGNNNRRERRQIESSRNSVVDCARTRPFVYSLRSEYLRNRHNAKARATRNFLNSFGIDSSSPASASNLTSGRCPLSRRPFWSPPTSASSSSPSSSSSESSLNSIDEIDYESRNRRVLRNHFEINWQDILRIQRFENDLAQLERGGEDEESLSSSSLSSSSSSSSESSTSDFSACFEASWNKYFDTFEEQQQNDDPNNNLINERRQQQQLNRNKHNDNNFHEENENDNAPSGSISFYTPPSRIIGTDDDEGYDNLNNDRNSSNDVSFDDDDDDQGEGNDEFNSYSWSKLKRKDNNLLALIFENRRAQEQQDPLPGTSGNVNQTNKSETIEKNKFNSTNNNNNFKEEFNSRSTRKLVNFSEKSKLKVTNGKIDDQEPVARRLRSSKVTTPQTNLGDKNFETVTQTDSLKTAKKRTKSILCELSGSTSSISSRNNQNLASKPTKGSSNKKQQKQQADNEGKNLSIPGCSEKDLSPPKLERRGNQYHEPSCSLHSYRHKRKLRLRDLCVNSRQRTRLSDRNSQQLISEESASGGHSSSMQTDSSSRIVLNFRRNSSHDNIPSNTLRQESTSTFSALATSSSTSKQQRTQQATTRCKRKRLSSSDSSEASPSRHSYSSAASDVKCLGCIERRRRCSCLKQSKSIRTLRAGSGDVNGINQQERPLSSSSLSTATTTTTTINDQTIIGSTPSQVASRQRRGFLFLGSLSSGGDNSNCSLVDGSSPSKLISSSGSINGGNTSAVTNNGGDKKHVKTVMFGDRKPSTSTAAAISNNIGNNNTSSDNNNSCSSHRLGTRIKSGNSTESAQNNTSTVTKCKTNIRDSNDRHSCTHHHHHHHHNHHHHHHHRHHNHRHHNHNHHNSQNCTENQPSRRFNKEFETRRRAERKRRQKRKRKRGENECERYHNHISGYIRQLPLPRVLHSYLNYDRNL